MNKEDMIYDIVCEIRDQNNKRFESVEADIKSLMAFKNHILGITAFLSVCVSGFIAWIKNNF